MTDRTDAQEMAASMWRMAKPRRLSQHEPFAGFSERFRRMCTANMRNAWVAYHAGAPWMQHARPGEVSRLRGELLALSDENARLRAELRRADERERADELILKHTERDLANARAEVERREQEYQRLYAQRDRIHAMRLDARAEVERMRSELHATQKAKRENDDRFMRERDAARAEVERLRSGIAGLRAALLYGLKAGDGSEPEPTSAALDRPHEAAVLSAQLGELHRLAKLGEASKSKAAPAIWADGPDSEAARAYRGEARANWARLEALARDVEAATVDAVVPDPDHTPAVRRVVAWRAVGVKQHTTSIDEAYAYAVDIRMQSRAPSAKRLHLRMRMCASLGAGIRYMDSVRDRLAAYLRHRDESKGYR